MPIISGGGSSSSSSGSGNGIDLTTIAQLTKALRAAASINDTPSATGNASTAAGWFTNLALHGVAVDTNWSADTYKQILSVSGAGIMVAAISPTLNATEVATMEVTVDGGTAQTEAFTMANAAERAILGAVIPGNVASATAQLNGLTALGLNAAKRYVNASTLTIPAPLLARLWGLRVLRFQTSLLVRMKTSVALTTTTNQERQAGVAYLLD